METYRRFNDEIEVSNLGNVKMNGELVTQHKDEYYYYVYVDGKYERVHPMVGKCFPEICGEWHKHYHYHHLNGNQLDNRAENIRCLSPSEHKKLHQIQDGISIGVKAYNKNGEYVGEWSSVSEAADATGISYRHINNIINERERRFTAGKLFWFKSIYSDEEIKNKITEIISSKYQSLKGNSNRKIKN